MVVGVKKNRYGYARHLVFISLAYISIWSILYTGASPRILFLVDIAVITYSGWLLANSLKHKKFPDILYFFLPLAYGVLWVHIGLDITDTGYSLSHAWYGRQPSVVPSGYYLVMGSHIANGLWLKLLPYPSVIWARYGGILLLSLIFYLSVLVAGEFMTTDNKLLLFVSLAIIPFLYVHTLYLIDYNSFPVFCGLTVILLTLRLKRTWYNLLIIGAFLSVVIFSRVLYLTFLLLWIYLFLVKKTKPEHIVIVLSGFFVGWALIFLLTGLNPVSYLEKIISPFIAHKPTGDVSKRIYSIKFVVKDYFIKSARVVIASAVWAVIIYVLSKLWTKDVNKRHLLTAGFITIGIALNLLRLDSGIPQFSLLQHYYSLTGLALVLIYLVLKHKLASKQLLIIAISLPIIAMFGSDTGIKRLLHNGVYTLLFITITYTLISSTEKYLKTLGISTLIFTSSVGLVLKITSPVHRELPIWRLNTWASIKPLQGILSADYKIKEYERLYTEANKIIKPLRYLSIERNKLIEFMIDKPPYEIVWGFDSEKYFKENIWQKAPCLVLAKTSLKKPDWREQNIDVSYLDTKNYKKLFSDRIFMIITY